MGEAEIGSGFHNWHIAHSEEANGVRGGGFNHEENSIIYPILESKCCPSFPNLALLDSFALLDLCSQNTILEPIIGKRSGYRDTPENLPQNKDSFYHSQTERLLQREGWQGGHNKILSTMTIVSYAFKCNGMYPNQCFCFILPSAVPLSTFLGRQQLSVVVFLLSYVSLNHHIFGFESTIKMVMVLEIWTGCEMWKQ